MQLPDIENVEIDLVLEAIYQRYGYDFRSYARGSIKRRLVQHLSKAGVARISELIPKILYDEAAFQALASDLSITVTEMFRDPPFYLALRQKVVPFLKTFPFVNIWHAGCATGEEAYSLAILLIEEGLYQRCRIYATDFNDAALARARERIYEMDKVQTYGQNYVQAGGKGSLSDYYHARYGAAILDAGLGQHITFANHNLVTDGVFSEMHMVLCRNVLIYFDRKLQDRVLELLRDSLCYQGFLCLGSRETIAFSPVKDDFVEVLPDLRIYQYKKRIAHGGPGTGQ